MQHSENLREAGEFHHYAIPPHKREGGTLENVARERPYAAKAITP